MAKSDQSAMAVTPIVQAVDTVGEKAKRLLLAGYLEQPRETNIPLHDSTLEGLLTQPRHPDSMLRLLIQSQKITDSTIQFVSDLLSKHGANPAGLVVLGRDWLSMESLLANYLKELERSQETEELEAERTLGNS